MRNREFQPKTKLLLRAQGSRLDELTSCVVASKWLSLSEPEFLSVKWGRDFPTCRVVIKIKWDNACKESIFNTVLGNGVGT